MTKEAKVLIDTTNTLLVAIYAPYNKTKNIKGYYQEFITLAETNGIKYNDVIYIKLRDINPSTFVSKGHLETIVQACEKYDIEHVIFSESLTPRQERNLSDTLNCAVFDRTQLILDIFEKHALSAEGKTQVEIAQLQHTRSRLAGKGVSLAQQKGSVGVKGGSGETLKEKETRYINERISKLKQQLEKIQQARETQRKRRVERRIPHICLVGYTNAGKSSILNQLTRSAVLVEDKPFATLDTTTRELYINGTKKGILSDTVGFIQQLPPRLIEAFKSTLSELYYADLLLHVIDSADPNWQEHIKTVHEILHELDVDKQTLHVFNKADLIGFAQDFKQEIERYQPYVIISALSKEGIQPLVDFLASWQPE